jgi:hypothetical protein
VTGVFWGFATGCACSPGSSGSVTNRCPQKRRDQHPDDSDVLFEDIRAGRVRRHVRRHLKAFRVAAALARHSQRDRRPDRMWIASLPSIKPAVGEPTLRRINTVQTVRNNVRSH